MLAIPLRPIRNSSAKHSPHAHSTRRARRRISASGDFSGSGMDLWSQCARQKQRPPRFAGAFMRIDLLALLDHHAGVHRHDVVDFLDIDVAHAHAALAALGADLLLLIRAAAVNAVALQRWVTLQPQPARAQAVLLVAVGPASVG